MGRRNMVAALDVGTSKVAVVVGEPQDGDDTNVVGVGVSPSRGIRKGAVVDIEATVQSVAEAVEKAQRMAGVRVRSVCLGISGGHIASFNSRGVVAVARDDKEITPEDVARVLDAARVVSIPADREIIHVIPRQFIVDGTDGIRDPVSFLGVRLEVEAQIVTGAVTSIQNLLRSVYRAGLEVDEVVLSPLAAGEAVLLPAEREMGAVVADIGGGTTDIGLFTNGSLCFASAVPVGGDYITSDIAVGLRTPIQYAERLKVEHGVAACEQARDEAFFEIPGIRALTAGAGFGPGGPGGPGAPGGSGVPFGGSGPFGGGGHLFPGAVAAAQDEGAAGDRRRQVSERVLAGIIEPRAQEIFALIAREIKRSGYEGMLPGGVVLTGGTALLRGIADVAATQFDLPVRVGVPEGVSGLPDIVGNPTFAAVVGILRYVGSQQGYGGEAGGRGGGGTVFKRVRAWLRDFL
jgi:cell division protein FtsA